MDDQLVVGHRVVIRALRRVVPAPPPHFGRVGIEHVEDVALLPAADLDADGVDQDQLVDAMARGDGDLGRDPAAERQSDHVDFSAREVVEQRQVEAHEVVHRVEILGPRRMAETGRGGRDHLGMAAEQIEKRRLWRHAVHAVDQQKGPAAPAPQLFQLDAVDLDHIPRPISLLAAALCHEGCKGRREQFGRAPSAAAHCHGDVVATETVKASRGHGAYRPVLTNTGLRLSAWR